MNFPQPKSKISTKPSDAPRPEREGRPLTPPSTPPKTHNVIAPEEGKENRVQNR